VLRGVLLSVLRDRLDRKIPRHSKKQNERNTVASNGVLSNVANGGSFGGIDAGFEWKMNANWSLWVEYDHIFRSNETLVYDGVGAAPLGGFPEIIKRDFDKVLFGINYRFGGPVVARY